jgi:integrase
MAAAPIVGQHIAEQLAQDLGGLQGSDAEWLNRVLHLFPAPTVRHAPYVFEALERLVRTTPWSMDLLDEDFVERVRRICPQLTALRTSKPGRYKRLKPNQLSAGYSGDFLFAEALLEAGGGVAPPKGVEALRLVLVACQWRWSQSSVPHVTAITDLASTIRGVSGSELDQKVLFRIGQAANLTEFLKEAEGITASGHRTMSGAWRDHFEPELRGTARPPGPPRPPKPVQLPGPEPEPTLPGPLEPGPAPTVDVPPPPPSAPPTPGAPSAPLTPAAGNAGYAATEEDELVDRLQAGIRVRSAPRPPSAPEPLAGEPAEEVTQRVLTSPLPEAPPNEDADVVVRHQVRQAIWSTNYLLLPSHPDVLPLADYARVVGGTVSLLRQASAGYDIRAGGCGLLIQALFGRTARSMRALSVLECATGVHDPDRMDLLLKEGGVRLSCFWKVGGDGFEPSYFRPDDAQLMHLEPVRQDFLLPLAPAFMTLLRDNADALRTLVALPVAEIEARLRDAARVVADSEGIGFTMGQLRGSMPVHLFEQCRDTAATQLICADTLGQSAAPLSYYAPRARALSQIHWTFQNQLLGTSDPLPDCPSAGDRVGSQLLVRLDSAQAMARAPAKVMHYGLSRLIDEDRIRDIHQAMVGHVAGMLMAVATHRPTEALLELTVADLLIEDHSGAALFRDKIHDAAHDPRLVALPATVCRQLIAYLEHLSGLQPYFPDTEDAVRRILRGKSPLLMGLSDNGRLESLDLKALKTLMPESWGLLPMNWGRHWMRTHAVEQGVRPELASMQLGHLEAVGYPFSKASPTEPWLFVETLAPEWEQLARAQGWQVVRGLPAKEPIAADMLTPLNAWGKRISDHAASHRLVALQWREAMKSKLRAYREQAEKTVLAHPELVSSGVVTRYNSKSRDLERHALSRADFERIRDEVYEAAGEDLALAIANANAVCDVARTVNTRTRQLPETPGKVFCLRRPLDNAFVPGMMEAVRQIRALRAHVSTLSNAEPAMGWEDDTSAFACAALAMVLFGCCESAEQIRGAIARRGQLQRSANLQDTVLVPWGDESHQVLVLRGVAAHVLARLSWKKGGATLPDCDVLNAKLAEMLPDWALWRGSGSSEAGVDGVLERLCETTAVANRYELSPAARKANGLRGGSTPAHILEQLAFLDGDPAGTVSRTWEASGGASPSGQLFRDPGGRKGNARSQYLALCKVFPATSKDTELPLTGERIKTGQGATPESRAKIIAEIEAQLQADEAERRLQPIVRMLASWTIDLLVNGTPKTENPALSTVENYLTRVGAPLVHIFGQSGLSDVDEVELEDAYLVAIESKSADGKDLRQKTAAGVLLFHAHAQRQFGLPEVDLSEIKLYLREGPDALSDARLILPAERDAIVQALVNRTGQAVDECSQYEVRLTRQASQLMPLIGLGGLRRGEGLGLQFRDISERNGQVGIRIRPNSSRRLKTVRARRALQIPADATAVGGLTLPEWIQTERSRLRTRNLETAFVFSPTNEPFDASVRAEIAEVCLEACRHVTGRQQSRLHALRHLVAMERTTPVFLADRDREALAHLIRMVPVPTLREGVALPRDLLGQVLALGHADPETTVVCYHHLVWLLRSRTDCWLASQYVNRTTLAPLLGVSQHALDWAAKQRPGRDRALAWLDVCADVRAVPAPPDEAPSPAIQKGQSESSGSMHQWTALELGSLLDDVARVGSLEKTLLVRGADPAEATRLRLQLQPMERRLGRMLLEERGLETAKGAPRRRIKRVGKGRELEKLLGWYDQDQGGRRVVIGNLAETLYEYLQPTQADRIHLPSHAASQLRDLLKALGIGEDQFTGSPPEAGLEVMRILRVAPKPSPGAAAPDSEEAKATSGRYLGTVLKRILLIIRLVERNRR